MDLRKLTLKIFPNRLAVCRLDADAPPPDWIDQSGFYSITRTEAELTIVCDEAFVVLGTTSETGWRCFKRSRTPGDDRGQRSENRKLMCDF